MISNAEFLNEINNPVRNISVMVELYNSSTIIDCFFDWDKVKSVKIERNGEGKFFGYGVCQKATVNLIDTNRELNITTDNYIKIHFVQKVNMYLCIFEQNDGQCNMTYQNRHITSCGSCAIMTTRS